MLQVPIPEAVELEAFHFGEGLVRRPALESHAISGHHHAGPVRAMAAVDEDRGLRLSTQQAKEFLDLRSLGKGSRTPGKAEVAHAPRLDCGALLLNSLLAGIQVYDDLDAQRAQCVQAFRLRLTAAIQALVHASEVGQAMLLQLDR
ncbi:MAG TPA: hypothetical protein VNK82_04370 [Terriglobales bacterium]|nr:hypothetical protein [Terriglobales bacterium]